MSQLLDQLAPHMRAFFDAFFQGNAQTHSLEELRQQVGPELEITVGRYRPYQGQSVDIHGHLYLPRAAIHVERDMVHFSGSGRLVRFYQAADVATAPPAASPGAGGALPTGGPAGTNGPPVAATTSLPPYQYTLVRVVELVDPLVDDVATMTRLLSGLTAVPPGPGGNAAPPQPGRARQWAEAIAAQRERDPQVLAGPLEALSTPPAGSPAVDIAEYKEVMYRMCTYVRDGSGTYYPKNLPPSDGGMPKAFPEGTTDEYRAFNAREVAVFGRSQMTCLTCHEVHRQSTEGHRQLADAAICSSCHVPGKDKTTLRDALLPFPTRQTRSRVCDY